MTGQQIASATLLALTFIVGLWFYMQLSRAVTTMTPLSSLHRYSAIAATIK